MDDKVIVTLTDDSNNKVDYELLDIIMYDKKTYTVFYPTVPNDTEVLILRVEDIPNTDNANYVVETDEHIVKEIYKMFKEKYKGKILFAEGDQNN